MGKTGAMIDCLPPSGSSTRPHEILPGKAKKTVKVPLQGDDFYRIDRLANDFAGPRPSSGFFPLTLY